MSSRWHTLAGYFGLRDPDDDDTASDRQGVADDAGRRFFGPLWLVSVLLGAALVSVGYEAAAAALGDGSFDLDQLPTLMAIVVVAQVGSEAVAAFRARA